MRCAGYVFLGLDVTIWDMRAKKVEDSKNGDGSFVFPCRRLVRLDLDDDENGKPFLTWHPAIMLWGFSK